MGESRVLGINRVQLSIYLRSLRIEPLVLLPTVTIDQCYGNQELSTNRRNVSRVAMAIFFIRFIMLGISEMNYVQLKSRIFCIHIRTF